MLKSAARTGARQALSRRVLTLQKGRRCLGTAPAAKRTWKGAAVRWGLAGAGVYYYNTSNLFAEEPEAAIQKVDESIHHIQESKQPTIDAIVEEKRLREAQAAEEYERQTREAQAAAEPGEHNPEASEEEGGLEDLEEEAGQQGAFNPETGEINWDCPCLGGMAHGPCGEEFRAAFSCFVYSNEEPKGVECIDKFKGMQDCFREHPEMYGSELQEDEEEVEEELARRQAGSGDAPSDSEPKPNVESPSAEEAAPEAPRQTISVAMKADEKMATAQPHSDASATTAEHIKAEPAQQVRADDEKVPRAAHDATSK